jgi:curli biogenesis system outer membrane secretion channel CsgG
MKTPIATLLCAALLAPAAFAQDAPPATIPGPAAVETPPAARPVIGVLKFQDETGALFLQGGVGRVLTNMLTNELSARPAFTVVERQKLRAVLEEQDLSQSGRVSAETSIAIGKLTGAQYLITGTVTSFEERIAAPEVKRSGLFGRNVQVAPPSAGGYLAVDLRVIDTTTGEIRHARTVEGTTTGAPGESRGDGLTQGPDQRAVRAAVIEIVDYLQCAMVVRDECLAAFDAREQQRRETTRRAVDVRR